MTYNVFNGTLNPTHSLTHATPLQHYKANLTCDIANATYL